mgnify:CR=1 FL=1
MKKYILTMLFVIVVIPVSFADSKYAPCYYYTPSVSDASFVTYEWLACSHDTRLGENVSTDKGTITPTIKSATVEKLFPEKKQERLFVSELIGTETMHTIQYGISKYCCVRCGSVLLKNPVGYYCMKCKTGFNIKKGE